MTTSLQLYVLNNTYHYIYVPTHKHRYLDMDSFANF